MSLNSLFLLHCMSPDLALLGPRDMSDLSPQSEPKRTLIRSRFYEYALVTDRAMEAWYHPSIA
jgi:hypothetical protein